MGKLKKGLQLSVGSMMCGVGKYQKFEEDENSSQSDTQRLMVPSSNTANSAGSASYVQPTGAKAKRVIAYSCEECGHKGLLKTG